MKRNSSVGSEPPAQHGASLFVSLDLAGKSGLLAAVQAAISALRISNPHNSSRGGSLDLLEQFLHGSIVGRHLVVGDLEDDDPERAPRIARQSLKRENDPAGRPIPSP
jgi:hypothetical protein